MDHWVGPGWSDRLVGGIQISQWRERERGGTLDGSGVV